MWFLTRGGIDRYNGSEFKNYKLQDGFEPIASMFNVNWLQIDNRGNVWQINKNGTIFEYDHNRDNFKLVYRFPSKENTPQPDITYGFLDEDNVIWLCSNGTVYRWDILSRKLISYATNIPSTITKVIHSSNQGEFIIGTDNGIHFAQIKEDSIISNHYSAIDDIGVAIRDLYLDNNSQKLLVATTRKGLYVYDPDTHENKIEYHDLQGMSINAIRPFKNNSLLIATDGAGVFKTNTDNFITEPYIVADYEEYNKMNGNAINDIYIDEEDRIWMSVFPVGITMVSNRFLGFKIYKHSIGGTQSLINDQVNGILEDSDGDIWFATGNGISLLEESTQHWTSFFDVSKENSASFNHIFLTLCEVEPGIIWAGGYNSDIYIINKKTKQTSITSFEQVYNSSIKADKYIRCITKGEGDDVWVGGFLNFKRINKRTGEVELFDINSTTCILQRNKDEFWIGTRNGLFLLNSKTKAIEQIHLPIGASLVYTLYEDKEGGLYIGTSNSGLLYYNIQTQKFEHFHTNNSSLISNNIYNLVGGKDNSYIIISTENGLSRYYTKNKEIKNWTKDQGLTYPTFNAISGTYLNRDDSFIFGGNNGAIRFKVRKITNEPYKNRLVFKDFSIDYELIFPRESGSVLTQNIDNTKHITLGSNQNVFSLKASSINYDYQSDVLYSWMLEGFFNKWSVPTRQGLIRFTGIPPGNYTLRVRAISNENKENILEERSITILVEKPFWLSVWAFAVYAILLALIAIGTVRYFISKRKRKESEDKIQFFINSAHDIRTPLSLVKAPLEEIRDQETLSQNGVANMNIAIRNVNALLRMTTNLINFERADVYSSELYISEHELYAYLKDIFSTFQSYAQVKHINFNLETNFKHENVWFDREKMDSILKNIISNALKYTPDNGSVTVKVDDNGSDWSVEVKDTGIGVPSSEVKNLFKMHFRGSNAINSKVVGSGIGLMLVWKLVKQHDGKISFKSKEQVGSTVRVSFPKYSKKIKDAHKATNIRKGFLDSQEPYEDMSAPSYTNVQQTLDTDKQRILIVEDNDDLRQYLKQTLASLYIVQTAQNGKEALSIVKAYNPDLIISDIMMPEMRGDELCRIIKKDIETSHIPVILLTALNDEKSILNGLDTGADEYISKPFNIAILKATIYNLLVNRALLRKRFASPESLNERDESINFSSDIDWNFITTVKKKVEENLENQDFNVDSLCNLLNMSRTSFYNKIKALTNQAPADYIRAIRLNKAAELLKTGKYSIIEVADMTGYNDAKYFREVFKKHFKVSPSKYAKASDDDEA